MHAVLIVASDDGLAARLILDLVGAGLAPRLARNSVQAIAVARTEGPLDAVLVESTLPDSPDLLRALAQETAVADVPMLVVAAAGGTQGKDALRPEQVLEMLPGLLEDAKAARDEEDLVEPVWSATEHSTEPRRKKESRRRRRAAGGGS